VLLEVNIEQFRNEFFPAIVESLGHFGPELQVAACAIAVLLLDLVLPQKASRHLAWLAVIGCLYPATSVFAMHADPSTLFLGMIAIDSFANFFKVFFLLGGIPVILLSYLSKELEGKRMGEYYSILLLAIVAGMLMASSNHLLMAFMSLELLSMCSYVLVGFHKKSKAGSEAALKYIIYGSVASAVMGYGLSLLYGLSGSGYIPEILAKLSAQGDQVGFAVLIAYFLTFIGLAYKMATIPMHFWSPDVYEGAPTPITAFLSVSSKAAGFALCLRFFAGFHTGGDAEAILREVNWPLVMIVVSILTMTLGNFAALWQENLKRLFAYSSIAHAGYMMMGVVLLQVPGVDGTPGVSYIAFYLLAYLAMNFGAFAVIILIENRTGSVNIKDYESLGWKAPFLGIALTIFLFSLVGIPPTAGFTGKFQLLKGVIETAKQAGGGLATAYYVLAVAAVLNTAVSVYYYAKIIRAMYLSKIDDRAERIAIPTLGTLVVAAMVFLTIYLFLNADSILEHTLHLKILS
jgi:NADH-quinone oxidoreductase subunit N